MIRNQGISDSDLGKMFQDLRKHLKIYKYTNSPKCFSRNKQEKHSSPQIQTPLQLKIDLF